MASRQRLPQTLSCNSCTSPYAGGCCCCCVAVVVVAVLPVDCVGCCNCCKWHKQIYMLGSNSRGCLVWHVLRLATLLLLKVQSVKLPRSFGPLQIDERLADSLLLPCPCSPSAAAHHMINHQLPCLSVCQFVSLLCLLAQSRRRLPLTVFTVFLNCCLCIAPDYLPGVGLSVWPGVCM